MVRVVLGGILLVLDIDLVFIGGSLKLREFLCWWDREVLVIDFWEGKINVLGVKG